MREVLDVLEALGIKWFVTGSEAAGCYGVLRQTFDTDVVIDLPASDFEQAEFLLRRLYPEESEAWFAGVVDQLRAAHAAGTWSGFQRPDA